MGAILLDIPAEAYHTPELGTVSKSALDQVERSPAHYRAWLEGKRDEESDALAFGSALHCAVLEPARFEARYVVQPDFGDCRYKEAKAARDTWLSEHHGARFLSTEDMGHIKGIQASIKADPIASKLLRGGQSEVTLRWADEETGLPCKARTDYWVRSKRLAIDLKSTQDASPGAFSRSVHNFRYHVQEAVYREAFKACGEPLQFFVFLAVEKTPPYALATYTLDLDALEKGHRDMRRNIATLAECVKADKWPAYAQGVHTLSLPPWAK